MKRVTYCIYGVPMGHFPEKEWKSTSDALELLHMRYWKGMASGNDRSSSKVRGRALGSMAVNQRVGRKAFTISRQKPEEKPNPDGGWDSFMAVYKRT